MALDTVAYMAAAAYKSVVEDLQLPDLLMEAENVRDAMETPGWKLVQASIAAHTARLTQQLVHPSTKADRIDYLRGQIEALGAMSEAATGIIDLAKGREAEAIKSARAQESYV